jgi:hypothetical protein
MTYYKFTTPEADYTFVPVPTNQDGVHVYAAEREELDILISSLELAGVAEGRYFEDLSVEEDFTAEVRGKNGYPLTNFVEMTWSDLALFTQFEILNFAPGVKVG